MVAYAQERHPIFRWQKVYTAVKWAPYFCNIIRVTTFARSNHIKAPG